MYFHAVAFNPSHVVGTQEELSKKIDPWVPPHTNQNLRECESGI